MMVMMKFVGTVHVQRDKLKMEALRLASERANPKKYGSKIDVTSDNEKIEITMNLSGLSNDDLIKRAEALKEIKDSE